MTLRAGSSPRQRGTPASREPVALLERFIPAPAGNAGRGEVERRHETVHPRASGERADTATPLCGLDGSSPRQRGTLPMTPDGPVPGRFIPAPAGNAWARPSRCAAPPVHPRASGERLVRGGGQHQTAGSSPRQRGTQRWPGLPLHDERFIPAPAGNAQAADGAGPSRPVHPRASGERALCAMQLLPSTGSSPRQRGTHSTPISSSSRCRFIPAPAGNAKPPCLPARLSPVHPRASGERARRCNHRRASCGSSPRQRGTLAGPFKRPRRGRFIPAPAGNAAARRRLPPRRPVHPRASGERFEFVPRPPVRIGSSPRQRGTRHHRRGHPAAGRFIPAPAGNARRRRSSAGW